MLERLKKLVSTLWPEPGKTGLGWWLVVIQFAIVLLVGGGITYSAITMLRDLADEQGKARVQLAGAMVREDLRRMVEDAGTAARVLADRPTLQRLLSQGRTDAIPPILRRSCETGGMDACALFTGTQLTTQSGPTLDWQGIVTDSTEQGATFMALPSNIECPFSAPTRPWATRRARESSWPGS